jgi:hypothetical protein
VSYADTVSQPHNHIIILYCSRATEPCKKAQNSDMLRLKNELPLEILNASRIKEAETFVHIYTEKLCCVDEDP